MTCEAVDGRGTPRECEPMTTTDDVVPIRISGPAGLLATVPSILGFHPTKSLVLLCLSGDRRRVGPVARVDLPNGHDRAMAAHLTGHALRHADEVVVVSYQDSRRRPPLLDDLLTELARAGVDVLDAIVVRGGRARPALSAAMERSHPGIPLPDSNDPTVRALSAAGALAGRSVLADRGELRKSIAGPTGERLRRADHDIDVLTSNVPIPGFGFVPVVANVTAEPTQDPAQIHRLLIQQVTAPVRWEESIQHVAKLGITKAYELGSGAVLKGLVKRIAPTIEITTIGEPHEVNAFTES